MAYSAPVPSAPPVNTKTWTYITFHCTGGLQYWTVPSDVTSINFTVAGGGGGGGAQKSGADASGGGGGSSAIYDENLAQWGAISNGGIGGSCDNFNGQPGWIDSGTMAVNHGDTIAIWVGQAGAGGMADNAAVNVGAGGEGGWGYNSGGAGNPGCWQEGGGGWGWWSQWGNGGGAGGYSNGPSVSGGMGKSGSDGWVTISYQS